MRTFTPRTAQETHTQARTHAHTEAALSSNAYSLVAMSLCKTTIDINLQVSGSLGPWIFPEDSSHPSGVLIHAFLDQRVIEENILEVHNI